MNQWLYKNKVPEKKKEFPQFEGVEKIMEEVIRLTPRKRFWVLKNILDAIRLAKKEVFDGIENITVMTDDGYETEEYERLKTKHLGNKNGGEVMHLDTLCNRCGWFNDSCERPYGCDHPEQEEKDDETKKGKCFGFSCPIANTLSHDDEDDRKILGDDWESLTDGDWLQVHSKFKEV